MRPLLYSALLVAATMMTTPTSARAEPPALQLQKDKGVAAHPGLDGLYQRFFKAYHELDVEAAASNYSDDALYLAPGETVRVGRAAIQERLATFITKTKQQNRQLLIRFAILQRRLEGNLAYDVGIATLAVSGQDGFYAQNSMKFTIIARKQGKDWKWQVDSYSSLYPPKPGAPEGNLEKSVGQVVTLSGTAREAKGSAVLLTATGAAIYIKGLDTWPKDHVGRNVILYGLLKNEKYLPEATVDKDGAVSQGASGTQWVVEYPTFQTTD